MRVTFQTYKTGVTSPHPVPPHPRLGLVFGMWLRVVRKGSGWAVGKRWLQWVGGVLQAGRFASGVFCKRGVEGWHGL